MGYLSIFEKPEGSLDSVATFRLSSQLKISRSDPTQENAQELEVSVHMSHVGDFH